ncbi:autotransporter-associated beta strand repeat-containing protein, partial [Polynucleobacter nymphae]|uniref:autotransporter-associated beta strand repeat-containing protein n=1 Tax=Polynucleobacter nymphae TaxID=2081043 RepID=UPI001C0D1946
TNINAGTVALSGSGVLPSGGNVTIAGGTLDLGTTNLSAGSLTVSAGAITGNAAITASSYVFTNTGSVSITQGLSGNSATLSKSGVGTLTLSNTNQYTGATTVSGGTLRLGTGGSLASASALIMTGTSIFDLYGNSQSIASLTGATGNTVLNSKVSTASTLTVVGGTTTYAGVIVDNAGTGGSVALALSGGALTLSGANTYTGTTTINGGTLHISNNTGLGSNSGGAVTINAGATLDLVS